MVNGNHFAGKATLIILFNLQCVLASLFAQTTELWHYTYNGAGDGNEDLYGMTVDRSGNILLIAQADTGFLDYASVVMKLSPGGTLVWMATEDLNGTSSDPVSILTDSSGNIYVAGSYDSPGNLSSDIYLVKFDSLGNQKWVAYFSSNGNIIDAARRMVWDRSGNLLIAGETGTNATELDALVLKFDTTGTLIWSGTYSNPENKQDLVNDLAVDSENNIYVCGNVYIDSSGRRDFQVFKMSSAGVVEWARHYNDSLNYDDKCVAIVVDNADDIIVTGESFGWGPGYPVAEIATIKYDAAGNVKWIVRHESSTSTALPSAITLDSVNNIYIVGSAYDEISAFDCITIKYNAQGELQWLNLINGDKNQADGGYDILHRNGTVYVSGSVTNFETQYDALVAGYSESGTLLYRDEWNSNQNEEDRFTHLAMGPDGSLIAAGIIEKINDDDLLVVKFAPVNNVSMAKAFDPEFIIYPNPGSDEFVVQGLRTGDELRLVDLMGREVYRTRIANEVYRFHCPGLSEGIYAVQIKTRNTLASSKLLIQR